MRSHTLLKAFVLAFLLFVASCNAKHGKRNIHLDNINDNPVNVTVNVDQAVNTFASGISGNSTPTIIPAPPTIPNVTFFYTYTRPGVYNITLPTSGQLFINTISVISGSGGGGGSGKYPLPGAPLGLSSTGGGGQGGASAVYAGEGDITSLLGHVLIVNVGNGGLGGVSASGDVLASNGSQGADSFIASDDSTFQMFVNGANPGTAGTADSAGVGGSGQGVPGICVNITCTLAFGGNGLDGIQSTASVGTIPGGLGGASIPPFSVGGNGANITAVSPLPNGGNGQGGYVSFVIFQVVVQNNTSGAVDDVLMTVRN